MVIKSLGSSNGRTPASEAGNIGSTPLPKIYLQSWGDYGKVA